MLNEKTLLLTPSIVLSWKRGLNIWLILDFDVFQYLTMLEDVPCIIWLREGSYSSFYPFLRFLTTSLLLQPFNSRMGVQTLAILISKKNLHKILIFTFQIWKVCTYYFKKRLWVTGYWLKLSLFQSIAATSICIEPTRLNSGIYF